ncbi:hypothetical protein NEHOM01_2284 [Nematocida homosporus]|uniref:uncharacterized protein n=1 Tax=Nematocida homosporus TaxID=1912981 RepID=UPI00221E5E65|nr:uncharacterized protein NEHOM01_2284 [Nematocida homosporus]KAI5187578.1 hypothetical protein NEHOM01_2284 [Nematocida homosporus]
MRVLRLTRSKFPLSTSSVLDIFQKIETKIDSIRYDTAAGISPSPGDLFLVDALDGFISDGKTYCVPADVFHEANFKAVIERTKDTPSLFRFIYYNRDRRYRLVHYLVCEPKAAGEANGSKSAVKPSFAEEIALEFLGSYKLLKDAILMQNEAEPMEELDMEYWKRLVRRWQEGLS